MSRTSTPAFSHDNDTVHGRHKLLHLTPTSKQDKTMSRFREDVSKRCEHDSFQTTDVSAIAREHRSPGNVYNITNNYHLVVDPTRGSHSHASFPHQNSSHFGNPFLPQVRKCNYNELNSIGLHHFNTPVCRESLLILYISLINTIVATQSVPSQLSRW